MSDCFRSHSCFHARVRRALVLLGVSGILLGAPAWSQAQPSALVPPQDTASLDAQSTRTPGLVIDVAALAHTADAAAQDEPQALHAGAVEHSAAYETRARIHRYASIATLPLFATELALGQSLYNGQSSGGKRGLHAAVGGGIVGLFAVNTVTGGWNLFGEGWKDPNNRKLRIVHGLLMMAADAGFLATEAYAPEGEGLRTGQSIQNRRAIHRNLAIASISVGTAGYLTMLFGSR